MTREKLFEFAAEKGWDEILEVAHKVHSLAEIAGTLDNNRQLENGLQIELRTMCDLGLLQLVSKIPGRYHFVPTVLGVKFMQEQNMKKGRTFSCQLCGTTTGQPHVCPEFYPEMREK